jgi:hypothetical protein
LNRPRISVSAWRLLSVALSLSAHVGSSDVYFAGKAGPYPLLVAIRPPDVIPGVARIEVRAQSNDIREIQLTPTPMTGPGAQHPPVPDIAQRSKSDPQLFEGSLWLMSPGSWEVHIRASGGADAGKVETGAFEFTATAAPSAFSLPAATAAK